MAAAQLELIGVLMGVGVRVGFLLPLAFPVAFWKALAGDSVGLSDLEGMDVAFARRIREISVAASAAERASRRAEQMAVAGAESSHHARQLFAGAQDKAATAAAPVPLAVAVDAAAAARAALDRLDAVLYDQTFSVPSSVAGATLELLPGGAKVTVGRHPAEALLFCRLAVRARASELAWGVRCIARGIGSILP